MGTSPAIHLWTVRQRNDVATILPLEVFTQRNFVADFFRQKLNFTGKMVVFERGVGHFRGKFQGERGVAHQLILASEK